MENTSSDIHKLHTTAPLNVSIWSYCPLQSHFQIICTKETVRLQHKNYRLCNSNRCRPMYGVTVFRQGQETCSSLSDNYWCNCNLTKNVGHKLCMNNSSPQLFDDLHTQTMNCCRTVRQNIKVVTKNNGQKMKLKQGFIQTRVSCNLMPSCGKANKMQKYW